MPTIRRTPEQVNIPRAGKEQDFLNMLEFGGVYQSNNPFNVPKNTAADMQNLYINEEGTFTTRPRLEKIATLNDLEDENIISIFNLSDNSKFIHTDKRYILFKDDVDFEYDGELVSPNKIKIVEEDGDIYILSDKGLYIFKYDSEVELLDIKNGSHIPVRYTGATNQFLGIDEEPLNLLNDKYKVRYLWDGEWDYDKLDNIIDVEEKWHYAKEINIAEEADIPVNNILHMNSNGVIYYEDGGTQYLLYLFKTNTVREIAPYPYTVVNFFGHVITEEESKKYRKNAITFSSDFRTIAIYNSCPGGGDIWVRQWTGTGYNQHKYITPIGLNLGYPGHLKSYKGMLVKPILMSDDGNLFAFITGTTSELILTVYKLPMGSNEYTEIASKDITNYFKVDSIQTRIEYIDNNKIMFLEQEQETSESNPIYSITTLLYDHNNEEYNTPIEIRDDYIFNIGEGEDFNNIVFGMSENGESILAINRYEYKIYKDILGFKETLDNINLPGVHNIFILNTGQCFFVRTSTYNTYVIEYITFIQNTISSKIVTTKHLFDIRNPFMYNNKIYYNNNSFTILNELSFEFTSIKPNLIITFKLHESDFEYEKWSKLNNIITKSRLKTNFDNETWLANENYTFKSKGNTMSYFPINNFDRYGTKDEITGFNILGDSFLMLYKRDSSFLIELVMTDILNKITRVTESKHNKGNIAFGETIVTPYSELPLQITTEGILTISQVENIATSERVTHNLTEHVLDYIKEKNKENIITCSYKYWTFIYLNKTIYLLDSRNAGWYIWKVPIDIKSFWVEDDVLHCIGSNFKLYKFTDEEVYNEINEKNEYFDDGDNIIDWRWKSQLLVLKSVNFLKRLISTRFIVTDTDSVDDYGFDFKYHIYRKEKSETPIRTLTGEVQYIKTKQLRTHIPRFNYVQLELSNIPESYTNNKLNLIGVTLRYQYLEATR